VARIARQNKCDLNRIEFSPNWEESMAATLLISGKGQRSSPYVLVLLVAGTLLGTLSAEAKGWSSTGGGSGALCFDKPEKAALIEFSRTKNGILTDSQLSSAVSLESLDLHEAGTLEKEGITAFAGRQLQQSKAGLADETVLYAAAMNRLRLIIPEAASRIQQIYAAIVAQKWEARSSLNDILDRSDRARLAENCIFVQILARHSSPGDQMIPRTNADLPTGIIEVDLRLWNRLDVLNKAALLFHESLYILAASHAEHRDSLRVRAMTRKIFSLDLESLSRDKLAREQLNSELRLMLGLK